MQEEFVQVQWTAAHLDEARSIGEHLLEKRLVACVSIIPIVESLYVWDDEIEKEQEIKVMMKTLRRHYTKIEKLIRKYHSYEIPEIIVTPVIDGADSYLKWIETSVGR